MVAGDPGSSPHPHHDHEKNTDDSYEEEAAEHGRNDNDLTFHLVTVVLSAFRPVGIRDIRA